MLKKICTTLVLFLALAQPVFAGFSDVKKDDPNLPAIQFLEERGIRSEAFAPRRPINLAEFLKFAYLASGKNSTQLPRESATRFTDVPSDAWFAPFVAEADRVGALNEFREFLNPAAPLTRGTAVKLALALFGVNIPLTITDEEFGFRDVRRNHRLAPYVYRALKLGVIEALRDDEFGLTQTLSRAEAATLFHALANVDYSDGGTTLIIQSGGGANIPGIELLDLVWDEVKDKFLFKNQIDEAKMLYGAVAGAVSALGDKYSAFLPPDESTAFEDNLSGDLEGIGAQLELDETTQAVIIVAPLRDSPAEKAGLKPKDVIISIDNELVTGLSLSEVVKKIKGPAGTSVKLTIQRNGATLTFTITRAKITLKTVTVDYQNNIAVLSVTQFGATTTKEFSEAAKAIDASSSRGIILDLRNNPGGLLLTAIDVLGYFLPRDSIAVKARSRDTSAPDTIYKTQREPTLDRFKLVVLVNKGSASASEIVAGALKDYAKGTLIGETTFGKGTVQELSYFTDGSALKLTVAHWFSPKEMPIDKVGITPDVAVAEDANSATDEVLARALSMF